MNAHISITTDASATDLPFRFEIGSVVDHISGNMRAVVLGRGRTSGGTEVYAVELTEEDDRPIRVMRGPYLKASRPRKVR